MKQSKKTLKPGQKIRVLVVDDSVVVRRLLANAIESDPALELAGVAMDGQMALERIKTLEPDIVTMDIEMPRMNGIEAVRAIRKENADTRIIMFSTLSERGAAITLEALMLGADDALLKVVDTNPEVSQKRLREELLPRIKQFFQLATPAGKAGGAPAVTRWKAGGGGPAPAILAIGISTGGPKALEVLLPAIPKSYPLPVVIVQHMPPLFTKMLAERLNTLCALEVREAAASDVVEAGRVLIAPGNFHMRITGGPASPRVALDQSPAVNSCRPAVDVLFQSLADQYGGAVLAAVLTGMGSDGLAGVQTLKQRGAYVVAQDEATSVVWGMPGAVVQAGLADAVLPLSEMAGAFQQALRWRAGSAAGVSARQEGLRQEGLRQEGLRQEGLCRV
jgi:two-component system, chemotaxis family, protein-glutamate methylesterase/glutaminase